MRRHLSPFFRIIFKMKAVLYLCALIVCCRSELEDVDLINEDGGYEYYKLVDMHYKFYKDAKLWFDAYEMCRKENATLAMPKTPAEMKIINDIVIKAPESAFDKKSNGHYVLLGFHDMFTEGEFVTLKGDNIQKVYHKWALYQPDRGYKENCGSMHRAGGLNDFYCSKEAPFICEKSGNRREETKSSMCTSDNDYIVADGLNKGYKLHMDLRTFADARTICHAEGGHLAVIRSKDEEEFLIKMLKDPENFVPYLEERFYFAFLGIHDIYKEGHFLTITDEDLTSIGYANWKPNEPDGGYHENCVALSTSGGMIDFPCYKKLMYFCEKHHEDLEM